MLYYLSVIILFLRFCKILFSNSVILSKSWLHSSYMWLMHNSGAQFKHWHCVILRERSINASESLSCTLACPSPRAAVGIMTLVSWGLRRKSVGVDADTGARCLFTVWSRQSASFKARKKVKPDKFNCPAHPLAKQLNRLIASNSHNNISLFNKRLLLQCDKPMTGIPDLHVTFVV